MDPLLIVMVAVLAVFIFFQFRSSKKRRLEQDEMREKMVPGVEVMTQFGLYGTLVSIDEDKNEAFIETTPGTVIKVHRQVVMKVVEDEIVDDSDALDEVADDDSEPRFGERRDDSGERGVGKADD